MMEWTGHGTSKGVAIGPVHVHGGERGPVTRKAVDDVAAELTRLAAARAEAGAQLSRLYDRALARVGEQGAQIFDIHQMMLSDEDFCQAMDNMVRDQRVNAEYAADRAGESFARLFSEMDDAYMRARAADVKDIAGRLVDVLTGRDASAGDLDAPAILAAQDLAPSETVQLDKDSILAFVTAEGSANSHTAILARTMGIPAVVKVGEAALEALKAAAPGTLAAVDGHTGKLYLDPDEKTLALLREKQAEQARRQKLLDTYRGLAAETVYGQRVLTYANIGSTADLDAVLQNDAEGVGLFRTEFLYLESDHYPTEEEQFAIYRQVVETLGDRQVVFRTLDIGADKQADYFGLPAEENPAMGMRAIRICLTREQVFLTQLRALLRASAHGKLAVMFPMITSLWEIRAVKALVERAKGELREEGIPFDEDLETGIMIETPAAAVISNQLAAEVDFFSIGTNDLTQYLLAVDRQNQTLDQFFDPHHPALLELIRVTAENAHRNEIWVGICGELAADLSLTETFLAFGIDELSVAPASVLPLREKVCGIAQDNSDQILAACRRGF